MITIYFYIFRLDIWSICEVEKKPIRLLKIYHKYQLGWQQSYAVNVKNNGMTNEQSLL